ncbi:MAG TPA: hypothetical protein VHO91_02140 [Rhodopila sp.]|nr:hypothetical protein [Rhodopila sp.]
MDAAGHGVPGVPTISGSGSVNTGTLAHTNSQPAVVGGSAAGRATPTSHKAELFTFRHDIASAGDTVSVSDVVLDAPPRHEAGPPRPRDIECVADGVVTVTLSDRTRVSFSAVGGEPVRRR